MIFRQWTIEDIPAIAALEKICFSDAWTEDMLKDGLSSQFFYSVLAEENGQIAGYACEYILFEVADIGNVAVAPEYRKQGIGEKMMRALENEAKRRGANLSSLEVRVSNDPAQRLYTKRGYKGVWTRKKYYADGEDALIMQKTLD